LKRSEPRYLNYRAPKRERFVRDYGLTEYDATLLVPNHAMASFFEAVVTAGGLQNRLQIGFWAIYWGR
jgi:Asp-tRNA(Asn)/Glu-tRNA(Gln) amidotransferase B subunit